MPGKCFAETQRLVNKEFGDLMGDKWRDFCAAFSGSELSARQHVTGQGAADFCQPYENNDHRFTAEERVLLYCHGYFDMHYNSSLMVLRQLPALGRSALFIDFGCGPGTSGIAFRDYCRGCDFHYIGVDRAAAMLKKARRYIALCRPASAVFYGDFAGLRGAAFHSQKPATVMFNFSFLLSPNTFKGGNRGITVLRGVVGEVAARLPAADAYALYQNPAPDGFHANWTSLKSRLSAFESLPGFPKEIPYGAKNPVYCDILHRRARP